MSRWWDLGRRGRLEKSIAPPAIGTSRRTVLLVLRSGLVVAGLSALLNILVLPFVLQEVSIDVYGQWATLAAVVAVLQLVDAGISTDIARQVADAHGRGRPGEVQEVVQRGLTVLTMLGAFVVALAIIAAQPILSLLFPDIPGGQRTTIVAVYFGSVLLLGVGLALSGYVAALGGLQRADYNAWGNLAGLLVGTVATVVAAGLGLGLWALFAGACGRSIVGWTVPLLGLRHIRPDLRFRFRRVGAREALSYFGAPSLLVLASASYFVQYQIDKFVLAHFRGADDAGLYQLALNFVLQGQALALIPLGVLLAATAELYGSDRERLNRVEHGASSMALCIAAVVFGGLIVVSDSFYRVWLGPGYEVSAYATQMLAAAALVGLVAAPWYYYMLGRGLYRYTLVGALSNLVVNLSCSVLLTPRLGITGALIGTLAGNTVALVASWLLLRRIERREWITPALRPYTAVALVAAAAIVAQQFWAPQSWGGLIFVGALFVVSAGGALLIAGASPITLERHGRRVSIVFEGAARQRWA